MKQLTYVKKNTLEWWDVPEPTLKTPNEALVRPFAVARCDLDLAVLRGSFPLYFKLGKLLGKIDDAVPHVFGQHPYSPPLPLATSVSLKL